MTHNTSKQRARLKTFLLLLSPLIFRVLPVCVSLRPMGRKGFLVRLPASVLATWLCWNQPQSVMGFSPSAFSSIFTSKGAVAPPDISQKAPATVAYKPLSVSLPEFGVNVPVASWFPLATNDQQEQTTEASTDSLNGESSPPTYNHRISVRKIGQLLAKWNIPSFVARNYSLTPTGDFVADGTDQPLPTGAAPVVLLAHGYLGSRYDLSHLAEKLAAEGFICLAAEYPESLAASYDPADGLDRSRINQALLETIESEWKIQASSYGIVGHSLGCGTALQTGDDKWTRVLISGFPKQRDGTPLDKNLLLLTSTNDGLMTRYFATNSKEDFLPPDFELLEESTLEAQYADKRLPQKSILIFDRPDGPNHISFLSESVNDAMIEFLSPLLPVARAFDIPVLDFDRYQVSRDSVVTAQVVHPIVMRYLKQEMLP